MEKTVLEYLQELPDGYRERAIANTKGQALADFNDGGMVERLFAMQKKSLKQTVAESFIWFLSPEGDDFWRAVFMWADSGEPLPLLPTEEGASA